MWITVHEVVSKRADYTRNAVGWTGEFRGPFVVRVEAPDLESCRQALFAAANERITQWLTGEWQAPSSPVSTRSPIE